MKTKKIEFGIFVSITAVILIFCRCSQSPVSQVLPDPIEFESVWQHLKVYSIYQDSSIYKNRIPSDAFEYETPELMMESIGDTLGYYTPGSPVNYTKYYEGEGAQAAALSQAMISAGSVDTGSKYIEVDTLTDSTVYLAVHSFTTDSTHIHFFKKLHFVAGFPNIVIDLKENLGGDLNELDSLIEAFLPAGKNYIMARERAYDLNKKVGRTIQWHPWTTITGGNPILKGKKIAVLIDGLTASASEILAAGLYDCASAHLIGERSYGKGIGQIIISRRTRPPLQITYLQLRGVSNRIGYYHRKGIEPDTIPQTIINEGKTKPERERDIFYAVKMLEPGAAVANVHFPLQKTNSPNGNIASFKRIEDDF